MQRGTERRHLGVGADRDAQPAVRTSLADQDTTVEQALPHLVPVAECAEQHEVGVGLRGLEALRAQPRDGAVAFCAQLADAGEQLVGMRQRDPRGRLGDRGQVVGQPHDAHCVDDCGRCGEVAEPSAGERERLLIVRVTTRRG